MLNKKGKKKKWIPICMTIYTILVIFALVVLFLNSGGN